MSKVNTKSVLLIFCALVICISAVSQAAFVSSGAVYKTVHKDGTITYSDQPSPNAIEVVLDAPTSTIQSKMPQTTAQPQVITKQKVKYELNIVGPEQEATIRSNVGEISIAVAIAPKLAGFFQLHINEQIHESATGMFMLNNMERGAYQYSIKFIDNSGKVIASSELRKLYLHRASALIN